MECDGDRSSLVHFGKCSDQFRPIESVGGVDVDPMDQPIALELHSASNKERYEPFIDEISWRVSNSGVDSELIKPKRCPCAAHRLTAAPDRSL